MKTQFSFLLRWESSAERIHRRCEFGIRTTTTWDAFRWVRFFVSLISAVSNSKNVLFRPKYGITEERIGFRGTMKLIVRKFSPTDVGTYHCVSTNSLGRAEGTLRLYGKWYLLLYKIFFASRENFTGGGLFSVWATRLIFRRRLSFTQKHP